MEKSTGKRVGVFICHCGKNIAGGLDVGLLLEKVRELDHVTFAGDQKFSCSEEGQNGIVEAARSQGLNRIVVAACDPSLHLNTFQRCAENLDIDPSFVTLIDIRKWTMHGSPEKADPLDAGKLALSAIGRAVKRIRLKRIIPTVAVEVSRSVLVIGGGIAGVEASLEMAGKGYHVHLVERLPTIGGKMALLYKVFPTNDCAPCILAPKTAYANSHPGIDILTNATVTAVRGHVGRFVATVERKPSFIDQNKCTGCGICIEKCPVEVDDEYSCGLGRRGAVHLPFPHAIPHKPVIDGENCLYLREGKCGVCLKVCPGDAVDFEQQTQTMEIEAGAIIAATGFEEFDPSALREYGYGRHENIITQMQLARMLDIDGPTGGELRRPSDGETPRKIVMIQCVGSRDRRTNPYCSGICCMYALKHAQIIKEMVLPEAEITVCYIDMRTPGKDFEEYFERTREIGIGFVRGRPSEIEEDPTSKNLLMLVDDPDLNMTVEFEADLVVLSCAMRPSPTNERLGSLLGVRTGPNGFFREMHPKLRPVETDVRGVYICGCAQGPKDIPQSIIQAKAAASCADSELRSGEVVLPEHVVKQAALDTA